MKAVIMAGGLGTRLHPLTVNLPKPLVPVVNRSLLEHLILHLKGQGINQFILPLFFQPEEIKSFLGSGGRLGVEITYLEPMEDYGTAGCVKYAGHLLNSTFVVASGDLLTDFNLMEMICFHKDKKAAFTVALTRVKDPLSYGVVTTNKEGKIIQYLEKPSWGEVFSDTINCGIYVIEPDVLAKIPAHQSFDFSNDLFPLLLREGFPFYGFLTLGYWRDVGNIEDYRLANWELLEGKAHLPFKGRFSLREGAEVWMEEGVEVGEGVSFRGKVVVGERSRLEKEVKISSSIIGPGCLIGKGANIERSILFSGVRVGERGELGGAILGSKVEVGSMAILSDSSVVGDGCLIGSGAQIKENVRIWPSKSVEAGSTLSTALVWGEKWNRELFTEAKVSGVSNIELTPEFVSKLGAATGAFWGKGGYVAMTQDSSSSSQMISRALSSGLLSAGMIVDDLEVLPLPLLRFELKWGRENAGVHIRQSPYEGRISDIIFFDQDGKDLPVRKAKSIERLFFREDFHRPSFEAIGRLEHPTQVKELYRERFLEAIDLPLLTSKRPRLVIDYSYGSASTVFPPILGALGCEVVSLNAYLDPQRLTRSRKSFESSLNQLSSIVTSLEAEVGFLLDVVAERLYIVDSLGHLLSNDMALLLVISLCLEVHTPRKIAVPITASKEVERMVKGKGVEVIRTRDDHRAMMEAGALEGVGFVGGTRGGFIYPDFQVGCDAMFATAKILELLAKSGRRIEELKERIGELKLIKREVFCPREKKGKVMRALMKETEGMTRDLIDGIRLHYPGGWVLLLPDSRRPYFRVLAESDDSQEGERLSEEYIEKIRIFQEKGDLD